LQKPPCKLDTQSNEELSSVFGREFLEEMLYSLFNPDNYPDNDEYIDQLLDEQYERWSEEMQKYMDQRFAYSKESWLYREWLEERAKREFVREKAWKELMEAIKSGKIKPESLSAKKVVQTFAHEVLKGLEQEGYVEIRSTYDAQRGYSYGWLDFTNLGEDVIAKKILDEVLENLEFPSLEFGEDHEGQGNTPASKVSDFDELMHHYDLIDLYETLAEAGIRNSDDILNPAYLKARIPESRFSSSNVILIDSSNSMYGPKFKGAIMASLALKRLLEEYFREDKLYIVAYDDEPLLLKEGDILRLRPQGNTDIGCALDFARELLRNEEGNKNVFLITDGEPTCSYIESMSPEENAYRAAYLAGQEMVNINIVLLDQKPELRAIAENMARLNGRSTITYVNDPLHLKDFVIKTYARIKGLNLRRLKI
jgi:Mg-chelatase subunit ChlD